jgi:hypothetical protein
VTIVETGQRSEAWYSARRGLPTASRFDQIVTPATGALSKQAERLIDELIVESIYPPEEGVIRPFTADMEWGMKLEAEARCYFDLSVATAPVKEVGFILHESGLFGCSPDGLVGEDSGLELKCPSPVTHVGYCRAGVLPLEYKAQVHGSMVVTGRSSWSFMSYARHLPPFHLLVNRDDYTAKLEAALFSFCARYNEARKQFGLAPIGNGIAK